MASPFTAILLFLALAVIPAPAQTPLAQCIEENKDIGSKSDQKDCLNIPADPETGAILIAQWCTLTVMGTERTSTVCVSNACPKANVLQNCVGVCKYSCVTGSTGDQAGFAGSGSNAPTEEDQEDDGSGLSAEAILGIVLGSAALLCFLMFVCSHSGGHAAKRARAASDFVVRQRKHAPSPVHLFVLFCGSTSSGYRQ